MKRLIPPMILLATVSGCSIFRSVDDSVSTTLEGIPAMKFLGIESRHSEAKRLRDQIGEKAGAVVMTLHLQSADWVNPTPMQQPAPVRIWIYELDSIDKFANADTRQLLSDPARVLGTNLRWVRDIILAPGEEATLRWAANQPGYVGLLADFREPPKRIEQQRQTFNRNGRTPEIWQVHISGNAMLTVARLEPDNATGLIYDESTYAPLLSPRQPATLSEGNASANPRGLPFLPSFTLPASGTK